ncbi:hypothetical protein D3C72_1299950 [compost metagenome]
MHDAIVVQAEFELGVGDDDAARGRVFGGRLVKLNGHVAHLGGQFGADALFHFSKADIFVMLAQLGLGRRGEDRFRQFFRLLQARWQLDAADAARVLVIFPARTDDVATHDCLDHDRLQALGHDGAALHLLHFISCHHGFRRHAGQVVRHDMAQFLEPEIAHLVQDLALAGDRLVHDDIEGRQAVRGDDQDLVVANGVIVADLAVAQQWQGVDGSLIEAVHSGGIVG